ncbi:MAG TPA: sigma-70 family RNA polymerase sigma factor [Bryobacteraceae bacterium]|nr:sigma-70 family RNA polymerase sigma factor [Bryobacteraceae bacterium]
MLPVREEDVEDRKYHQDLGIVRERILGFVLRKLVPHRADFAQAEDIAQSCVVALWEQYPDKRDLAEMVRIAIGAARHKIAQFHRDREKAPDISDAAADLVEYRVGQNPHSGERIFERTSAREETDRLLLAMVRLPGRCRGLMRMKLIEQKSYAEIRELAGISGNIYEMTRRCFQALLRNLGGVPR